MTRFTLISAIYNVAGYLPDFLESLDKQDFDHSQVQVVLVDDGSTDDSGELLASWTTDYDVTIVRQTNAGQGAARNAGLEAAVGEWISFPDPDDILDPQYLSRVHESLEENPSVMMVAAHLLDFWEARGEIKDSHPLRYRFAGGTQMVDLDRFPRHIHLHASSAFFRRIQVEKHDVRFDSRIRPVFEDAHFVQTYLLTQGSRLVTFNADAHYLYRRRESGNSTLQTSGTDPARYTDVLEFGLLDLLRRAAEVGQAPRWLQYAVLYDLFWILRSEDSLSPKTGAMASSVADRFEQLLLAIRALLTDEAVKSFDIIRVSPVQREALLHGARARDWHWDFVQISEYDQARELMKLTYRFVGRAPHETLTFRGLEVQPMVAKTRSFKYLGKPLLHERSLWVSSRGTIEVKFNGVAVPLRFNPAPTEQFAIRPAAVRKKLAPSAGTKKSRRRRKVTADDRLTTLLADSRVFRDRFAGAWIFMDRSAGANDNAEHLFKYTRKQHPSRNAWFVVDKNSSDWARLKDEGVDRLIPHGSRLWKIACLNAVKLVSSHIDLDVIRPFVLSNGRTPRWDYVFLQHGVTQNDLSAWLNTKSPSLILTATEPEYRSIAGDNSSYKFSGKEVVLTGFPRFDRLAQLDARRESEPPRYITVFPTWRKNLGAQFASGASTELDPDAFVNSRYAQEWLRFLRSTRLQKLAEAQNLQVRFMPHPSLEPVIDHLALPSHIEVVRYRDRNVQEVIVESAAAVTDYSSIVFDAAFIDRPVLYFQFDRNQVFGGDHIVRPGYFSYDDDGFGPVAATTDEALTALAELVARTHPDLDEYAERRKRTFTLSRKENCKRAYRAILATTRKVSPTAGTTLHPTPEAQPTRYLDLTPDESRAVETRAVEPAPVQATVGEPARGGVVAAAGEPARGGAAGEAELMDELAAGAEAEPVEASAGRAARPAAEEDAA